MLRTTRPQKSQHDSTSFLWHCRGPIGLGTSSSNVEVKIELEFNDFVYDINHKIDCFVGRRLTEELHHHGQTFFFQRDHHALAHDQKFAQSHDQIGMQFQCRFVYVYLTILT